MAVRSDDLEFNPFYQILLTKYHDKYDLAMKKSWIICVPHQSSLKGISITQEFIDCHILKPSPFFKSHYVTTDRHQRSYEFDDGSIKMADGSVKILAEELGYNVDFKPFKILIIERPLNSPVNHKNELRNGSINSNNGLKLSTSECEEFLQSFPQYSEPLRLLRKKMKQFQSSYMVLPQYLHDAAIKLQDMTNWATQVFSESHGAKDVFSEAQTTELAAVLESYILGQVHGKVFPVVKKRCAEEDSNLTDRLLSLYEAGLTPDQLGVREPFCCQTPSAVVELASLNSKSSPAEKLICLKMTLELLNQDVEKSLQETYSPVSRRNDVPCMTSDDLIPLLVTVLVQARPQYLGSNLHYIQNFCWQLSTKDKLSFSLVTFQAAKEFLKSSEINLKPSKTKMKKEISLEELMTVTVELQKHTRERRNSEPKAHHTHSPVDHQLQNITKMIEASTREHHDWPVSKAQQQCRIRSVVKESPKDENLGGFLSSLHQSSLGFSYGKKT